MAIILSDSEITKLLDHGIISDGDRNQVRPNSYVFRLGTKVKFSSTGERKEGEVGDILEIDPGDSALITSLETLNLEKEKICNLYEMCHICAFLTPITTLMREGLQLLSTKIDPGYSGTLNWTIRNSGVELVKLEVGEPIYKATFFLLQGSEELPEKEYGERREQDFYQGKKGLVESKRRLPVDADKRRKLRVSSRGTEFDRLKQSGFPYDFIATQLQQVGDSLEIVSKDFIRIDEKVTNQTKELSTKIDGIRDSIPESVDDKLRVADALLIWKFIKGGLALFTVASAMIGGIKYLIDTHRSMWIAPIAGCLSILGLVVFILLTYFRGEKK